MDGSSRVAVKSSRFLSFLGVTVFHEHSAIVSSMKSISLSVSEEDYEAFRAVAEREGQSIAALIREAMSLYRSERIRDRGPLERLPVLAGHQPLTPLPSRTTIYDEMFGDDEQIHE